MGSRVELLKTGNYYKANMHCHTTVSDGKCTPKEIKEMYKKEGYSVVAYTDHSHYQNHEELNDENFLAIAGYEVGLDQCLENRKIRKRYHINLYDTNPSLYKSEKEKSLCPQMQYEDIKSFNTYLKKMTDMGFMACYNHPYWSLQEGEDYLMLKNIFAMEIYNHGCELDGMYGYSPHEFDRALRNGKRWYTFATDDNHNARYQEIDATDSFGGFIMLRTDVFSYRGVIEALKRGEFYSSMGPEFKEIFVEDNMLVIRTSPVKKIYAKTDGRFCHRKVVGNEQTTEEARFILRGDERYLWIEIQDAKGRYANTNAFFENQWRK